MTRKQRALVEYHEELVRLSRVLDGAQAYLDRRRHAFDEERAQDLQDRIDRQRFDVELDLLVVRARRSKK